MGLFCVLLDEFYYEILLFCYSLYGFSMTSLFSVFSCLAGFFFAFYCNTIFSPRRFFHVSVDRAAARTPPLSLGRPWAAFVYRPPSTVCSIARRRSGGLGPPSSIARRRSPAAATLVDIINSTCICFLSSIMILNSPVRSLSSAAQFCVYPRQHSEQAVAADAPPPSPPFFFRA